MGTRPSIYYSPLQLQTIDDHLVLLVLLEANGICPELVLLAVLAGCTSVPRASAQIKSKGWKCSELTPSTEVWTHSLHMWS